VGTRAVGKMTAKGAPAVAATVVAGLAAIIVVCAVAFDATAAYTFAWSGSIGTLILLVFVRRKLAVPGWQLVFPLGAPALLGYTVYVNVSPYPTSGPGRWFPVVAAGVLLLAVIVVIGAPGYARHMGQRLTGEKLSVEGAR
jgi:hypothetical protein